MESGIISQEEGNFVGSSFFEVNPWPLAIDLQKIDCKPLYAASVKSRGRERYSKRHHLDVR